MIDQDKMRALAKCLRADADFDGERESGSFDLRYEAADAIDTLLAALEVSDQKRKEAVLDAEKAREERNRGQVKINAEWIRRTAELRAALEAAAADKREEPSLTNPLTPYGMLVRALRIVTGTLLGDMAKSLHMPAAQVSGMEFGRIPVTPEIVRDVGKFFEGRGIGNMRPALQYAANASISQRQEES